MIPRLGELELKVMDALWQSTAPMTAREVKDGITGRDFAYTTIATVLGNLDRKAFTDRTSRGRTWQYAPRMTRSQYSAAMMTDALDFSGDPSGSIKHFVAGMSADEQRLLKQLLADSGEQE